MADELGVAALGLDEDEDAFGLAGGVGADEAVWQVEKRAAPAGVRILDGVLLHDDPLVAAGFERFDKRVGDVGVVGQGELGGHEAAHA